MKYFYYIVLLLVLFCFASSAQIQNLIEGKVSYLSSQNVYVKFESTKGIEVDDTLFIYSGNSLVPALIVNYKSSKSIAGIKLDKTLRVNDVITAKVLVEDKPDQDMTAADSLNKEIAVLPVVTSIKGNAEGYSTESESKLSGKFSVQSYSNFSNLSKTYNYQRWRYTFRLNAERIGNSNISYSQYISFAYRASEWSEISSKIGNAIRVYDLAFRYNFTPLTHIWLGRHLNSKISNISAIDGLQFETSLSQWSFGLIAGARPDFRNMGINFKLFEYGAYVNRFDMLGAGSMSNTISYFEQTNDFKTDRRFLYFQHSNSAIEYTRFFLSTEVDIFKKVMGENKSDFSVTSLFTSLNIRPSSFFSIYFSYDARKNVIYYETFNTFADSVFENETRQGFRTRLTLRPVGNLYLGASYGYRFRKGDSKPSNNYGGYITYSRIPGLQLSSTISFTSLRTSYVDGKIFGARLSRELTRGIDLALGYRFTNYKFQRGIEDLKQHSVSVNINTRLLNPVLLNITYEGIFEKIRTSGRLLINLTLRF